MNQTKWTLFIHKIIFLLIIISSSFCFIKKETYDEIKAKATFEVMDREKHAEIFEGVTYESLSHWKGENHLLSKEKLENIEAETIKSFFAFKPRLRKIGPNLPEEFDWRQLQPNCFNPVKDQKKCGSCYSFATTAVLETRICIALQGKFLPELSQQELISCDFGNDKCLGDRLDNTWNFLEYVGTCSYDCKPYASATGFIPKCVNRCSSSKYVYDRWYAVPNTWMVWNDPWLIKTEIYLNGPVSAGMETYEDFTVYQGGIYIHSAGEKTDYHAVAIVGWGYDKMYKQEYWICRNSWGRNWGEDGYFKVLFGMYEINQFANASLPQV